MHRSDVGNFDVGAAALTCVALQACGPLAQLARLIVLCYFLIHVAAASALSNRPVVRRTAGRTPTWPASRGGATGFDLRTPRLSLIQSRRLTCAYC